MSKLFLLRHLKSQWNQDNRFAGWVDNPLSEEGIAQAEGVANLLKIFSIDAIYTSPLIRNKQTVIRIMRLLGDKYPIFKHYNGKMQKWADFEGGGNYVPVFISENLNERYYGKLQGLNKQEVVEKYGQAKVHLWRRSYDTAPPGGESLKDVYKRAVPFYKKNIEKGLNDGKNILIVASHNSLRAIVKYIENISDQDIINIELPFGGLVKYEFDKNKYTKVA